MPPDDFLYFVSYARDDFYIKGPGGLVEDQYLARFFADLRDAVRSKAARQQNDPVEYQDIKEIELGQQWRPNVLNGLQKSRTLLALFTPTFFGRRECAVEVGFMQRRRRSQFVDGQEPHQFIIPVVWDQPQEIPPALASVNYFNDTLPPSYKDYGLKVLARVKKFEDDYQLCVRAIASQIDKVRQLKPLPELPVPPDAAELTNTFATATSATVAGAAPAPAAIKGPNGVRFAYVAAARPEIGAKGHQTPYGTRSEEWQPSPADDRVVGVLAPMVATASRFIPYQLVLDGTFQDQVKQAHKDNALVVLLVDVWTACFVARYRDRLQEYDGHNSPHCAALVVWNEQDGDLAAQREDLETALQHVVFPINHSRSQPYYHRGIQSVSELEAALRTTLERLRTDVATQAQVFRKLEAMVRPVISNVLPAAPAKDP